MKERSEKPSNHLSGRLPLHQPDEKVWAGIASSLDLMEKEDAYQARLAHLPVHKPDAGTWSLILRRMQWAGMRKTGYVALAAAASILLLFSIFRTTEQSKPQLASIQPASSSNPVNLSPTGTQQASGVGIQAQNNRNGSGPVFQTVKDNTNSPLPVYTSNDFERPQGRLQLPVRLINTTDIAYLNPHMFSTGLSSRLERKQAPAPRQVIYANTGPVATKKYYAPTPVEPEKHKGSNFTLAANYLPETLYNGSGNSLFHNVGLTASLGNEKTRLLSSLGMAYNSEHRVYDVDYVQTILITVPNPGSSHDSTYVLNSERQSEIEGVERHQYITYDLGFGRKLFSMGKITTWLNTGAGFAVRLDHSSLEETTVKTINSTNNAVVKDIDLQIPDYNGVNVNIMAGLDFNYRLMKKLSLSFAPVSRIYLKPVLVKDGLPTDSFSLGFRTGMKYDF